MFTTGIRTTLATLTATFAVAIVIAPAASAGSVLPTTSVGKITTVAPTGGSTSIAKPNNGGYERSAEAKRAKAQLCSDLKLIRDVNLEEYANAAPGQEGDAWNSASKATADGRKQGCSWAAQ